MAEKNHTGPEDSGTTPVTAVNDPLYSSLNEQNRVFLDTVAQHYPLSVMDIHNLVKICCDLEMWDEGTLKSIWPEYETEKGINKQIKKNILKQVQNSYNVIKSKKKVYRDIPTVSITVPRPDFSLKSGDSTILGSCPVASEKTRCCNLQTLDAVINCGFGCTYCTIQPFYKGSSVLFHENLGNKLKNLSFDSNKIYHIGTGQSSDSLMWNNTHGILDELFTFARQHSNVILELKTKSALPPYMKEHDIPENVLTTWSVNTPKIISHEELGSAPLNTRISGATQIINRKRLTGFHFHPMVYYEGWEEDYRSCAERLIDTIDPAYVAMVSIGTVTFIKPVISQIRRRKLPTKILQMQMENCAGKYSYPAEIKINMFSRLYEYFEPWHGKVFFYLCMEPEEIWEPVFGREYRSNSGFEEDMKISYMKKIRSL